MRPTRPLRRVGLVMSRHVPASSPASTTRLGGRTSALSRARTRTPHVARERSDRAECRERRRGSEATERSERTHSAPTRGGTPVFSATHPLTRPLALHLHLLLPDCNPHWNQHCNPCKSPGQSPVRRETGLDPAPLPDHRRDTAIPLGRGTTFPLPIPIAMGYCNPRKSPGQSPAACETTTSWPMRTARGGWLPSGRGCSVPSDPRRRRPSRSDRG